MLVFVVKFTLTDSEISPIVILLKLWAQLCIFILLESKLLSKLSFTTCRNFSLLINDIVFSLLNSEGKSKKSKVSLDLFLFILNLYENTQDESL